MAPSGAANFFVMCTGQVEFGEVRKLKDILSAYQACFGICF